MMICLDYSRGHWDCVTMAQKCVPLLLGDLQMFSMMARQTGGLAGFDAFCVVSKVYHLVRQGDEQLLLHVCLAMLQEHLHEFITKLITGLSHQLLLHIPQHLSGQLG